MSEVVPLSAQTEKIRGSVNALLSYCDKSDWAGYDPYDALNSRWFDCSPLRKSKICRIGFIQIMKRLPLNIRPFLRIAKEENSKGIAVFLKALISLSGKGLLEQTVLVATMVDKLVALRSRESDYWCWGYSFPWQTRTVIVPRGTPNLVCTVFVADALLDAYEAMGDKRCLVMAVSAADYVLNDLYWTEGDSVAGFSYPLPALQTRVHNANFLGAALLCRVYSLTGEKRYLEPALRAARYSASRQRDDGSWDYGEHAKQGWSDNFHTGYNLCALRSINRYAGTAKFEFNLRRGFDFYRKHFFTQDAMPKYFHDRTYPVDAHSVAQSIITLIELQDLDKTSVALAHAVYDWATKEMLDEQGYFYYQVQPYYKNKISYMRWTQAWMLLALAKLLVNDACDYQALSANLLPVNKRFCDGKHNTAI